MKHSAPQSNNERSAQYFCGILDNQSFILEKYPHRKEYSVKNYIICTASIALIYNYKMLRAEEIRVKLPLLSRYVAPLADIGIGKSKLVAGWN
jgi:hypothetical protein